MDARASVVCELPILGALRGTLGKTVQLAYLCILNMLVYQRDSDFRLFLFPVFLFDVFMVSISH